MNPVRFAAMAALTLVAAGAGCMGTTDPQDTYMLSYVEGIDLGNASVVVPSTAVAGEPFQVEVNTIWRNGCMRKGRLEVSEDPTWVLITPYDILGELSSACSGGSTQFHHTAMVTFNTPGTANVYVQGRNPETDEVITLDYEVVVQ